MEAQSNVTEVDRIFVLQLLRCETKSLVVVECAAGAAFIIQPVAPISFLYTGMEPGHALESLGDPPCREHLPITVEHAHVVVRLGPVDTHEDHRELLLPPAAKPLEEGHGALMDQCSLARYPSNFSPTRALSVGGTNIVRDLVSLPKHGFLIDFIYFPAPATGIRDQPFELFVDSPDLETPVFVKFEVR